ncbi:MAG: carotenoid 1,2-hydratase [Chthoniobacterales bacterium]|nr:carotenoid 1,2-hydratase [Chthoniobacterales bacterium]
MKAIANWIAIGLSLFCVGAGWQTADLGWRYEFPRDHHTHPAFKTEWWYFTGNLTNENGRRFGYELTFFRQGIRPPDERAGTTSRFIVDDLKFAHFTVTDVTGKRFLFYDDASRGSFAEAGFDEGERIAWIQPWSLQMRNDGSFDLVAAAAEAEIQLHLVPQKKPVIHGDSGISRKAEGAGHASHYYSITRLTTSGSVRVEELKFSVRGESWFDHEWATNQLAPGQAGWNWVSAQFDDGRELMLYQMRLTTGAIDPISSGTLVRADGTARALSSADFEMTPEVYWRSGATKADYPIGWRVRVPREKLEFRIQPVLQDQELVLGPLIYWEGAFDLTGTSAGKPLHGRGYLELTGYAGPLQELSR